MRLLNHYRKLWFFMRHRFTGDNRRLMREYFAEVFLGEIEKYINLEGKKVLDVGGGYGEFCRYLNHKRSCTAVNLDPREHKAGTWWNYIDAYADDIPTFSCSFDFVICRGVLEHISPKTLKKSISEMFRVLKPNGYAYFLIPPWYNPHAGHCVQPFHYFPFPIARFLRRTFIGKSKYKWGDKLINPKTWEEAQLYPRIITFGSTYRMLREAGFEIVEMLDSHLKLHFLTRIPVINEIFIPVVSFICRKPKRRYYECRNRGD